MATGICGRTGFGHERAISQDLVEESTVVGSIKLMFPLMVLPLSLIAAYFKILPLLLAYVMVSVSAGLYFVGGDKDRQQTFEAIGRPSLEESSDRSLLKIRLEILKGLKGKVLDLSPGSGYILNKYYAMPKNKVTEVTTFETNKDLFRVTDKNAMYLRALNGIPTLVVKEFGIDDVLAHLEQKDGEAAFDVIVSFAFLSRVKNMKEQLQIIKRLLKPGGTLIFMEYEVFEEGFIKLMQNLLNTLFKALSGGSECNREISKEIKALQGWEVQVYSILASDAPIISNLKLGFASRKKFP